MEKLYAGKRIHPLMALAKNIKQYRALYLMMIPGILFFVIFKYIPMYGITIAFKEYRIKPGILGSEWIGLHYFKLLFSAPDFYRIFSNTLVISILKLLTGFPGPIVIALLLNELKNVRYKKTIQTVIYFPHFLSWVVVGGIFIQMFGSTGDINQIVYELTGARINFLTSPFWFRILIIISSLWKEVGWGTVIYLAALSGVDEELYSAAYVDGANKFRRIWHVALPGIRSTIVILFILRLGNILEVGFEQIYMLSSPVIYDVSDVFSTYVFRVGLQNGRYSYTTAIGLFQNFIGLILIVTTNKIANKIGEYGIW